ncbi:MAG: Mrp/NBP35 family ATP-binding protein [SAR324 cluster bacterium]|nr:Mrp/NBP35 family ATP-binding protein [SAR324 cluster bacterium]
MDPLEQSIRDAFAKIPFGESNVLDQNIVYSLEIAGKRAEIILIVTKEDESFIDQVANQVHEALVKLDEIDEVGIRVTESAEIAEEALKQPAMNPAEAQHAAAHQHGPGCNHGADEAGHSHGHPDGPSQRPPQGGVNQAAAPQAVNYLGDYKHVILIASGKGGVGKSTTSVNLAMALKAMGKKVSLLDADIYGPSLTTMMGTRGEYPEVIGQNIQPLSAHGVEFMSMGNLVDESEAMIWRGPMAHQAVEQMLRDTVWPGGDYMIIDLPPGTGDVQLTLAQKTQAAGAVIVCTPQDVALMDARKAINMFDKVSIPLLGMVENMSFFKCPGCGEETPIFSSGGAESEAEAQDIAYLGHVPIELNIRKCGDEGHPLVDRYPESDSAKIYMDMAAKLDAILEEK